MRLALWFAAGTAICLSFWFVYLALVIISIYEQRTYLHRQEQILLLAGIIVLGTCLLHTGSARYLCANICSMSFLLVAAVIDAATGYVYNCFNYILLTAAMLLHGMEKEKEMLIKGELGFIFLYLAVIIFSAALHMIGEGDIPVYFALMFYYMAYSFFPAAAALFLLMASLTFYLLGVLINRKKRLPLVPYICLAHLITLCLWVR